MAEPAQRLDDEQDDRRPIYDKTGTEASDPRPQLKALEGGGESSETKSGHLKSVDSDKPTRDELGGAEKEPDESAAGSFYKAGKAQLSPTGFLRAPMTVFGTRRKKVVAGGAVGGIIVTASIFIFLSLIPLKIMHIVNNLQNRFYATSENAIQKQTDVIFKRYIREKVLPSYRNCGTTISRDCSVIVSGSNPVSNLYKTWANARIENKLADNHGIEFQKRPSGWYMITPSTGTRGVNIGGEGERLDNAFQKANRSDIRKAVKAETKWHQMYYRYKVGKLLEQKYGIKRCIIFCTPRDALADKKDERIRAAKIYMSQRVLVPRTETLRIAFECLIANCVADDTKPTEAEPGKNGALHGTAENPDTDTRIREGLVIRAGTYGITDAAAIQKIVDDYNGMSEKGYQKYILEKLFGVTVAGRLSNAVPVAGWIDFVARLINTASDSSRNLKKLSYLTNSTAAVSTFAMYRTYTDEMKTGNVNAEELGSFVQSLDSGDRGTKEDPQVGGNVGAEGTPLYSALFQSESEPTATAGSKSLISNLLSNKVLAATSQGSNQSAKEFIYKCNNDQPVRKDRLVCSEEVMGTGNRYADIISDALSTPPFNVLKEVSDLWLKTVGQVFDLANAIFGKVFQAAMKVAEASCKIPFADNSVPYCIAARLVKENATAIMQAVANWLIPNPFSTNMSGGRTFDMMAAGADVAGNDSAHTTLGGKKISDQQVATIVDEQRQNELQDYKNQPLIARVFDTESQYSPVSKLAMSMPLGAGSVRTSTASIFSNPLNKLGSAFSSIFSPNHVLAAAPASDPFGVTQYGYPQGSIPENPEAYWDKNCSDNPSFAFRKDNKWNEDAANKANIDPITQMPVNYETNPCLLIMSVAGSAGGYFDSSNLTKDDLADSSTGVDVSYSPDPTEPAGDSINQGQLFESSVNIACAPGTKNLGIQDGYTGGNPVKIRICAVSNFPSSSDESTGGYGVSGANGKAVVNSRVSGIIYNMVNEAKADGVTLSATSAFRTMAHQRSLCPCDGVSVAKPGYSNHQMGLAIDFAGLPFTPGPIPGNIFWEWLSKNAANFGYKNYPREAWHWSPTGN